MAGNRGLTIRGKLIVLTMVVSFVSLGLASAALIGYHYVTARRDLARKGLGLADVVGFNSAAALSFGDRRAADELLRALAADPTVSAGTLFDHAGRVFARYRRVAPKRGGDQTNAAGGNALAVVRPVMLDGQQLGQIVLEMSLDEVHRAWVAYAVMVGLVFVGGALVAFVLSAKLQQRISGPIRILAERAEQVAYDRNYSVRVIRQTDDELGTLVDQFNQMLAGIEQRDAALLEAQAHLEERVRMRTAELERSIAEHQRTERELTRARDAAESANRAKSTFIANTSHELRTPLNAIIGYSGLLQEDADSRGFAAAVPDLQKIERSGKHLLALINDVLDLSKIEAGKMTLVIESFAVTPVVAEAVSTVQPLAAARSNQLTVEGAEDLGTMTADPVRVKQVLLNLLGNAAKFTDHGRITLTALRERSDRAEWIVFRIADTGIGMTAEQMQRLFVQFGQGDSSTTRRFGGTGLGLAISRELSRTMGGDIAVRSAIGVGSEFVVRLPAIATVAAAVATPETAQSQRTGGDPVAELPDGELVMEGMGA